MTIRSIEAIPLSLPYEMFGPKPLFAGHPRQMEILLVRVETDDGQVGWGEAFGYAVWPATRAALVHLVAPLAIGRDETDIAALNLQLQRSLHLLGAHGCDYLRAVGSRHRAVGSRRKKRQVSLSRRCWGARGIGICRSMQA